MILKIFSVLDSKAAFYSAPFFEQTEAGAMRSFSDAVQDASNPNNMWHKHPEDFSLYVIGEFDNQTGLVRPIDIPTCLVTASALKAVSKQMDLPLMPLEVNGRHETPVN